MSYILDALRRAEADRERERGQVPGLHTQPLSDGQAPPTARRAWLPWAGAGLLLLAGIGAGSWWTGSDAPPPAPAAAPLPTATAPAMPVAPVVSVAPPPAASASPYLPPAVTSAPAPAAEAAPPPEARIPRLSELPESTRSALPPLRISGSVYSDDPAARFVIVNGEVQREGARLGPDLVLEQIGARELVLRFKGQRLRQPV